MHHCPSSVKLENFTTKVSHTVHLFTYDQHIQKKSYVANSDLVDEVFHDTFVDI